MGPALSAAVDFESHPSRYRHWRLALEPPLAILTLAVDEESALQPGYRLKLNSYDLGVDIELADAIARLRFEHPELRAVVLTGGRERVFSAGANIGMLASAPHPFKVNFCKFTNETRLAIEDACRNSGQHWVCAVNGTAAGGGYELALACEEIYLVDDGSSAVSLPEVPVLGVLPGTGGLTRLVDKRKVRRDLADVFATLAEGVRGERALAWGLVDGLLPRGGFLDAARQKALRLAESENPLEGPGIPLDALAPEVTRECVRYRYVTLEVQPAGRTAELTIEGPGGEQPESAAAIRSAGAGYWPLRAFRELDDALLRLRFHYEEAGVVTLRTRGDPENVRKLDATLYRLRDDWPVREILLLMARVLRRLDLTSKSFFALVEEDSCFAGSLYEVALAADRIYMKGGRHDGARIAVSQLNRGILPMTQGVSRLDQRLLPDSPLLEEILENAEPVRAAAAEQLGLATMAVDEIDWEDELRMAVEERASFSPDALTGLEANLRFAGPETVESKIFGRLSAWQNWVFARPNATGEQGALAQYGKPERPRFDRRRT